MGETDRPLILPPLRRTAKDAEAFARIVHEGQTDKAGRPYIAHVSNVAHGAWKMMVRGCGFYISSPEVDEVRQIAWLHDVIEDTPYTADDLTAEGFSNAVVAAVEDLDWAGYHKRRGGSYLDYIRWLSVQEDLPTILVKIADIEDNSDPERLVLLDEPTRERLKAKYGAALPILKDAAARLGWRKGNG